MAVGFPTKANWAAGDVLTASAQDDLAGTVNLLSNASATSGQVLLSNAAGSSFAYQSAYNGNAIINGGMDIFQRSSTPTTGLAVTTTSTSFYGLDRWQIYSGSTGRTVSRQATGDTTNLPNIQYCQRVARDSGNTNTAPILPAYSMETADAIRFAGQKVTISFYARAGANYSAASAALSYVLRQGTGTDQNLNAGYTGSTDAITGTATLTTTWQRFQATGTVTATSTELGIQFNFTPVGTAGANDYCEITGVQVELGVIATSFKRSNGSGGTIQGELAACQRYYYRVANGGPYNCWGTGMGNGSSGTSIYAPLPVTMRATPTVLDSSTLAVYDTSTIIAFTSPTINANESGTGMVTVNGSTTGVTQGKMYKGFFQNSTSAYIGFGAEL